MKLLPMLNPEKTPAWFWLVEIIIAVVISLALLAMLGCGKDKTSEPTTVNELPTQVNRVTTTDYCMSYQPYADTYTYARCLQTYDNGYGYYQPKIGGQR